jgi:hypothetical protein
MWYRNQYLGVSMSTDCRFEEHEDGAVWITLALTHTAMVGLRVEPFVVDYGFGAWLQGWSDGNVLTLCTPSGHLAAAAGYLQFLEMGAQTAEGSSDAGEGVPDESELSG